MNSPRVDCLQNYLNTLKAHSYVIEDDYSDKDYLADYTSYYAMADSSLPSFTARIHFFSFKKSELREIWDKCRKTPPNPDNKIDTEANSGYLGFVVLRPLQLTIVGRTCLRTYSEIISKDRQRHFPVLRHYPVMLFGMRLGIDSVAFQEQDNEIAACATTAIWYTLHALPRRITAGEIQSPYEISNAAGTSISRPALGEVARRFPTYGLSLEQIHGFLHSQGLECLIRGFNGKTPSGGLLEYANAFVNGGYPIMLVGRLYRSKYQDEGFIGGDLHAITLLGYSTKVGFLEGSHALRIDKLYAHDDNIGPFASFVVQDSSKKFSDYLSKDPDNKPTIDQIVNDAGVHLHNHAGDVYRKFLPVYAIVPIDPKVRFPYESVSAVANTFKKLFALDVPGRLGSAASKTSFSIKLQHITPFRLELRGADWISKEEVETLLCNSMSKYLWIVTYYEKLQDGSEQRALTILFDATALRQQGGILSVIMNPKNKNSETYLAVLVSWLHRYVNPTGNPIEHPEEIKPCVDRLIKELKVK